MRVKSLIYIILIIASGTAYAQVPEAYAMHIKDAEGYYNKKDYSASTVSYTKAFIAFGGKGLINDRYNAACSWALAGNIDSAFFNLFRIADKAAYSDLGHLGTDTDLELLKKDKRWPQLYAIVKANKDKKEVGVNKTLAAVLDTILTEDQKYRLQLGDIEKKYGRQSAEIKAHWKLITEKDSINLVKVMDILDHHGWLGADSIGEAGNKALFLVIQHADIQTQQKYLPMMRDAVKKKNASPASLALLEDRTALRTGHKQTYGSQIGQTPDGKYYVDALEDPDNVDKRRASVGLGPLADYVNYWQITWNVEDYKKQLPELESKLKAETE